MARFYDPCSDERGIAHAFVVRRPNGSEVLVEVDGPIAIAIEELQREYWRLERSESRHTVSLDAMPAFLVPSSNEPDPLSVVIRTCERAGLARALTDLPPKQLRRLLLYSVAGLTIRQIANRERCSERAIKYSISKARSKLRAVLLETREAR